MKINTKFFQQISTIQTYFKQLLSPQEYAVVSVFLNVIQKLILQDKQTKTYPSVENFLKALFSNPSISDQNKEFIREFLLTNSYIEIQPPANNINPIFALSDNNNINMSTFYKLDEERKTHELIIKEYLKKPNKQIWQDYLSYISWIPYQPCEYIPMASLSEQQHPDKFPDNAKTYLRILHHSLFINYFNENYLSKIDYLVVDKKRQALENDIFLALPKELQSSWKIHCIKLKKVQDLSFPIEYFQFLDLKQSPELEFKLKVYTKLLEHPGYICFYKQQYSHTEKLTMEELQQLNTLRINLAEEIEEALPKNSKESIMWSRYLIKLDTNELKQPNDHGFFSTFPLKHFTNPIVRQKLIDYTIIINDQEFIEYFEMITNKDTMSLR